MLNVAIMSVIMMNIVMLSVPFWNVMLCVVMMNVMLNVMAPYKRRSNIPFIHICLTAHVYPGAEVIRLFSSSLTEEINKLECFHCPNFFKFV